VLHREHPVTADVLLQHGAALAGLGRHAEAEAQLLEAHEILTAAVGADHKRTQKVVQALVDLYEAWGKTDKVEQWSAKIDDSAD